jgi:hypothetical protein
MDRHDERGKITNSNQSHKSCLKTQRIGLTRTPGYTRGEIRVNMDPWIYQRWDQGVNMDPWIYQRWDQGKHGPLDIPEVRLGA